METFAPLADMRGCVAEASGSFGRACLSLSITLARNSDAAPGSPHVDCCDVGQYQYSKPVPWSMCGPLQDRRNSAAWTTKLSCLARRRLATRLPWQGLLRQKSMTLARPTNSCSTGVESVTVPPLMSTYRSSDPLRPSRTDQHGGSGQRCTHCASQESSGFAASMKTAASSAIGKSKTASSNLCACSSSLVF